MEINKAFELVLELAQQNIINDPEMEPEMAHQLDAIETVRLFMSESLGENPSPVQVIIQTQGGVIHDIVTNIPVEVTVLDADTENGNEFVTVDVPQLTGEFVVIHHNTKTDPSEVASILSAIL